MEAFTCVETPLMYMAWLQKSWGVPSHLKNKVATLEKELRFVRTYLICIGTSKGIMSESNSIIYRFEDAFEKAKDDLSSACRIVQEKLTCKELKQAVCFMLETSKNCQPEIQEGYSILLKQSWQHKIPFDPESVKGFVDSLLENLTDLVDFENLNVSMKNKMEVLKKKLSFIKNFLDITSRQSIPHQIIQPFLTYVHFWASNAAFLFHSCWVDESDDIIARGMDAKLSDLLQKIMPDTSELMDMYVGLLKASKAVASDNEKTDEIVSFAKFLLENSMSFMDSKAATIQEELLFLLTFMINLQDDCTGDLEQISAYIKAIAREAGYLEHKHLVNEGTEEQIKERKCVFSKFLEKMKLIKTEIFIMELLCSKNSLMVLMKDAIAAIHEGMKFLKAFFFDQRLDRECFVKHVEMVASEVTSLVFSIHDKKYTKEMVTKMNLDIFWLLEKIKLIQADIHLNDIQYIESSLVFPVKDQNETLSEGLRSFTAFLMDNSGNKNTEDGKLFLTYLEAAASDSLPLNFSSNVKEMTEDLVDAYLAKGEAVANDSGSPNCSVSENVMQRYLLSSELVQIFRLFKAHIRQIYLQDSQSVQSILPRTDDLGFISSLSQNLTELLNCNVNNSISFVKHHLEMVHLDLEFLKSFLIKSMKQRNEHDELKNLWTCITTVAYEAECVIESFVFRDGPLCYRVLWLSAVMEEIKLIKAKVMETYDEAKYFKEVHNVAKASDQVPLLASTPTLDEDVVGFKKEEEDINGSLIRGTPQMDIISIVGMPGLGKTTLAKKVYNTPSVTSHFYVRAWCYVSQVYQRKQLLLDILSQIIDVTDLTRRMDADDIAKKLYQNLKKRRFLIVMDDLWDIGAWNDLRESLPDDKNGSRVLFTSRQQDLASEAKKDCKTFLLHPLSRDESWELLQKKIFGEEGCPRTLFDVGNQIAENCKGLPLSLVVTAGLLARTEKTLAWWKEVSERLSSHITKDPQGGCMHILEMSYEHLPDNLKSCFLYFGAFPEDKEIPIWKLSCLWVAEGFIQNAVSKSMEDAAEDFLLDLLHRSLIIVAKRRSNGRVRSCRVHDLLRELCLKKAEQEKFLRLINGYDEISAYSPEGLEYIEDSDYSCPKYPVEYQERRLCIFSERRHFAMLKPCGPQVRSLLFFPSKEMNPRSPYDISFISRNFKLIRVLDLESINIGASFPIGLELLVQLKYLAVRGDVKSIPSSITRLWNLETFLVKALRGEVTLPYSFWNLKRLRHVHINDRVAFSAQDDMMESSSPLENMDTLSTPVLSHGKEIEKILKRLPRLRKLRCIYVESWDCLKKCNKFPILDFLTHLESLKIFYHGRVSHPCQFNFPSNLKILTLSKFRVPWCEMSVIGRLRYLEVLKLLPGAFEGQTWEMVEGEFQNLKYLRLDNLDIAEWKALSDHLPCLEQLVLQRCKKLGKVPLSFGDISTLQMIEVHWCSQSASVSVKQILEEQRDMGNEELKVFISGMES